ncbi:DNA-processing protein DprA [Microbulbifer guangxiensis]|uniref:DNA-processing protein DprA n=1 Tax=Microbulbifer guangxiensis TaxID=2904249 RepID=UPI001F02545E|nr:DNA-processing protein DprA [Microbulbifer guangxiensis]
MDALTATLALMRLEGMGPARYWQLLQHFPSPLDALEQLPANLLQKLPERARQQWQGWRASGDDSELMRWVNDERARCDALGVKLLCVQSDDYPPLLKEISRPPPLVYVRGNIDALGLPQIAVVGARRASSAGLDNARAFSRDLAAGGFAITSGLALGVDAAAHRGALDSDGVTIAVLGTGVDRLYPRRNAALAEEIIARGGALVSEFPLGTGAEAANFPRRNRVISGLSLGVLLVEAAVRSGSLITARLAAEQNREVFAIPGSIHNPLARGCHCMIRQGATLVETSADIAQEFGGLLSSRVAATASSPPTSGHPDSISRPQRRIVAALGGEARSLEQLARSTGLEAGSLMAELTSMELLGLIEIVPGGYQLSVAGMKLLAECI